jgi:hypothetical protein
MQKPQFTGCGEPSVQWGSQGKKVSKRHFFEILGAKRNKLLVIFLAVFLCSCGNPILDFVVKGGGTGGGNDPGDDPVPGTTADDVPKNVKPIYIDTQDQFDSFCIKMDVDGYSYPSDGYYILRGNGVGQTFIAPTSVVVPFAGVLTGWYKDEAKKTTIQVKSNLSTGLFLNIEGETARKPAEISWLKFEADGAKGDYNKVGIVANEAKEVLFDHVSVTGSISVTRSSPADNVYVGGFVGTAGEGTEFVNCNARASVSATATISDNAHGCYVGGFAGELQGFVENSTVYLLSSVSVTSKVTGTGSAFAGGVAGKLTGMIESTVVTATVYAEGGTGGIYGGGFAGSVEETGIITKNTSNGSLTVTAKSSVSGSGAVFAGGFAGEWSSSKEMKGNALRGAAVITSKYYGGSGYSGGLVGSLMDGGITESSVSNATIESSSVGGTGGTAYTGGLVGYSESGSTITKSSFTTSYAGGIRAGFSDSSVTSVTAKNAYAGGIAGYAKGEISEVYTNAVLASSNMASSAQADVDARVNETDGIAAAGGITGKNEAAVSKSYAVVTVKARAAGASASSHGSSAGGISGMSSNAISNTFALARVDARPLTTSSTNSLARAGGIAGVLDNSTAAVTNSYAAGSVSAFVALNKAQAGGIVGLVEASASPAIDSCVALQRYVSSNGGDSYYNRVVGFDATNSASINKAYAYVDMYNQPEGYPFEIASATDDSVDGADITRENAMDIDYYLLSNPLGWTFNVWKKSNYCPYPVLQGLAEPSFVPEWAVISP